MLNLPIFGKKKLLLAFEYATVIADVAHQKEIPVNKELIERAEVMILGEFKSKSASRLATEMIPNVLSVFETN